MKPFTNLEAAIKVHNDIMERMMINEINEVFFREQAKKTAPGQPRMQLLAKANEAKGYIPENKLLLSVIKRVIEKYEREEKQS